MKKIISTVLVLSMMVVTGYAQGFYFRAGLGYAFAEAGQSMYDTPTPYNGFPTGYNGSRNNLNNVQSYNIKGASFSAGFQGVLGLGYMFSENVGVQLDGNIGFSNTKYTFNDNNVNLGTSASPIAGTISTIQQARSPFILLPSLVLQTGGDVLNLYTRFGLALPLSSKITEDQVITNAPGTGTIVSDDFTWQIKNSFSLGFSAAAGVRYKINDEVSVWGEISLLSMSLYIKQADLQSWTENGQNVSLSNYTNASTIKFSKTATLDSTGASQPAYAQPFSNVGINVGVSFNLSNNSGRHTRNRRNDDNMDNTKPFRRR